jgi:predicted metalloprotease with PDZ domain
MDTPRDLRSFIYIKELRFSLKTKIKSKATYLASTFTSKYYDLFFQVRSSIYTHEQKLSLVQKYLPEHIRDKGSVYISPTL